MGLVATVHRNEICREGLNLPSVTKATPIEPADPRDLIRERLHETLSLRALATAVHLSQARFRHQFIEQTGVGIAIYLLGLRFECDLSAFIAVAALTDGADTGGCADSAWACRSTTSVPATPRSIASARSRSMR